jgi:hypothetical protein
MVPTGRRSEHRGRSSEQLQSHRGGEVIFRELEYGVFHIGFARPDVARSCTRTRDSAVRTAKAVIFIHARCVTHCPPAELLGVSGIRIIRTRSLSRAKPHRGVTLSRGTSAPVQCAVSKHRYRLEDRRRRYARAFHLYLLIYSSKWLLYYTYTNYTNPPSVTE